MIKIKKITGILTALVMATVSFTTAVAEYSDIPENHWANQYIQKADKMGIFQGYEDGTFKPEGNITYQEFVKTVVSAIYKPDTDEQNIENENMDIRVKEFWENRYEDWAQPYLDIALKIGVIREDDADFAYGGSFLITREKVAKVLARASVYLGIDDIEDISETKKSVQDFQSVCGSCQPYVAQVLAKGIMNGYDNKFHPTDYVTRAEIAAVLVRLSKE